MIIKLAETREELEQILLLQDKNHIESVPPEERAANGFVTVRHNIDLLLNMNEKAPQVIAVENGKVVGYALVMLREFSQIIPILIPMFRMFELLEYNRKKLSDYNYYVMGQICIEESQRGKGVFENLYQKHKEYYSTTFELCLTEVSTGNYRSMKAHEKVGFRVLHSFEDASDTWNILLWDWTQGTKQQKVEGAGNNNTV